MFPALFQQQESANGHEPGKFSALPQGQGLLLPFSKNSRGSSLGPQSNRVCRFSSRGLRLLFIGDQGLSWDSTFSLEIFNLSLVRPMESHGEEPMSANIPMSAVSMHPLSNSLIFFSGMLLTHYGSLIPPTFYHK